MATVYEIKQGEVDMYTGADGDQKLEALRAHVASLNRPAKKKGEQEREQDQEPVNLMPYTFYEGGREPVYVMISSSPPCAITFPDPSEYGATSSDRYSESIVYRDGWVKFLQLRTKGKVTWMKQAKQLMVIVVPIIVVLFLAFVMALSLG